MNEKEINQIFKPKKKLWIIFFAFLCIAAVCIGMAFYVKYEGTKDSLNLSELGADSVKHEGEYVGLDLISLPKLLASNPDQENHLYFVEDANGNIYIARLSNGTFDHLNSICDKETEKLNESYRLEGFLYKIDAQMQGLALYSSDKIFQENELNEDNFSEYLGEVYIDENKFPISDRGLTLLKILALIGVLFLIFAVGYVLPVILKSRKVLQNQELVEDLKRELKNVTDTYYKDYKLYLTQNYIVFGSLAVKYEDVIWAYVQMQSNYGIKTGRDLTVHTRDGKRHTIVSVAPGNTVPDGVLDEICKKNPKIKAGYSEENKRFFENNKR